MTSQCDMRGWAHQVEVYGSAASNSTTTINYTCDEWVVSIILDLDYMYTTLICRLKWVKHIYKYNVHAHVHCTYHIQVHANMCIHVHVHVHVYGDMLGHEKILSYNNNITVTEHATIYIQAHIQMCKCEERKKANV